MNRLRIPEAINSQLLVEASEKRPHECCGYLAGRSDQVTHHIPLVNCAHEPWHRFESSPDSTIAAHRQLRDLDLPVLAIYHSHPNGPLNPSRLDLELHEANDAAMIVISPSTNAMRAWRVTDHQIVAEIEIAVS